MANHYYNTDQTIGVNVADTGGGFPASGVAGFDVGWGSVPADPTGEATPGSGNAFYNGPQFRNTGSTTVDLAAEGQGCHTLETEAWDNMGLQSGVATDGPLCFDSVAPTISAAPTVNLRNNAGPVTAADPVTISWNGSDATSGINHYSLYESKDGGAYTLAATTTAPTFNKNLRARAHLPVRGHRDRQRRQHQRGQAGHRVQAVAAPGERQCDQVLDAWLDPADALRRQRRVG